MSAKALRFLLICVVLIPLLAGIAAALLIPHRFAAGGATSSEIELVAPASVAPSRP